MSFCIAEPSAHTCGTTGHSSVFKDWSDSGHQPACQSLRVVQDVDQVMFLANDYHNNNSNNSSRNNSDKNNEQY